MHCEHRQQRHVPETTVIRSLWAAVLILFQNVPMDVQFYFHWLPYTVRYRSRHIDWLRAGRPWDRSSNSGRVKNFHFSISSMPPLGVHATSCLMGTGRLFFSGVKQPECETDHSQLVSRLRKCESRHPLLHTSIRLHGVVLN
jgi:hypothetical protein